MNVLITGGSGFIGRNITEKFNEKYSVFSPTHKDLELLDELKLSKFISRKKVDVIIHCANSGCYGSCSAEDFEKNIRMFMNIAKNSHRVRRIIFLGSGAEYGKERVLKNVSEEEFDKFIPTDYYGYAKYLCSKYIENSWNIVNLRLFGVYGKYENTNRRFISGAIIGNLKSFPIIIKQNVYFDYLFIDDLVRIIEWFVDNESIFKSYNCTRGESIDLISLAGIINGISKEPSRIFVVKDGLYREYSGDNTRLRTELANFKFTSPVNGIKFLYNYYAKRKTD